MYPGIAGKRFFRSFKINIVLLFSIILIPTVVLITSFNYYRNSAAALDNAGELVGRITDSVTQKTIAYLEPAARISAITARLLEAEGVSGERTEAVEQYLLSIVRNYPQVAIVYYGREDGLFLKADHLDRAKLPYVRYITPEREVEIRRTFDDAGRFLSETRKRFPEYDPRVRPWYAATKKSGKPFWTAPYIFIESSRPGISAACPFFDESGNVVGVAAADIALGALSDFLLENRISQNSILLISDRDNRLIAFSDKDRMLDIKDGQVVSRRVQELGMSWVTEGVRRFEDGAGTRFSYSIDGKDYLAYFKPFPESFGKDWRVVVLAPKDDFLGDVKRTYRSSMLISGVILFVAVLSGLFFARNLSKPIEALTREVQKIRNFELDGRVDVKSFVYEISTLSASLDSMKIGLQGFGRYVSTDLVREIVKSGEPVVPGGRVKELTLFFSDIENFTAISEGMPPAELMVCLSEYLDIVSRAVFEERGTVDKYMGDGVMAFWGAPAENETHAMAACRAALRCQVLVDSLAKRWKGEKRLPFRTRIGIHTDFAVVGNMGSEERLSYSVVGDGVNLASRLEGVNKTYGTRIVVSHQTWRYVRNEFIFRPIDIIAVRGKSQSVRIYELMGDSVAENAADLKRLADGFEKGFELYLNRNWAAALELLEQLRDDYPEDIPVQILIKRCCSYIANDPGEGWAGIMNISSPELSELI